MAGVFNRSPGLFYGDNMKTDWIIHCPYCQHVFPDEISSNTTKEQVIMLHEIDGSKRVVLSEMCPDCNKMQLQWIIVRWSPEKALRDALKHEKDKSKGREYCYSADYTRPLDMRKYGTRLGQGFAMAEGYSVNV
jgi:hypothetical protein